MSSADMKTGGVVRITDSNSKDDLGDSTGYLKDMSHDHDSLGDGSAFDEDDDAGSLKRVNSRGHPSTSEVGESSPSTDAIFMVKNLDTNEKFHIQEYAKRETLDLDTFNEAKRKWDPEVEDAGQEAKDENDEEHMKKKEIMGWLANLMKRKDSVKETGSTTKVAVKIHKKPSSEFAPMRIIQQMLLQCGPVWTMKFSPDANYLAVAGSDANVRVWTVTGSPADIEFTEQLARKARKETQGTNPPDDINDDIKDDLPEETPQTSTFPSRIQDGYDIINSTLFRKFRGHSSDVVDLSWSPTNFLLTASLDRSVRLWHVSKEKCLGKFQHADFVTSVAFHPSQVRLFLSGSYDKILRIWNILDHRVINYEQTDTIITSATFTPDGRYVAAGLISGQCVFFRSENLSYYTQLDCRNRRGKFAKGRKVTGLQFVNNKYLLVTTCDSRIRLYDMEDKSMRMKFKGLENEKLPIRASFSEDSKYVICGSEDHEVFIWNASKNGLTANPNNLGVTKTDHNDQYEHFKGKRLLL
eukprot:TRINITY_DN8318_c0_g1_i2.p1 TRINITY_DN8318_c0_g1~~TRINITY_DN8318_c0_g1_i2.p1  ORF type:complete len:561 (-),score=116.19 TRINITY_DN8318_c0_g1_i2:211-1785(-)